MADMRRELADMRREMADSDMRREMAETRRESADTRRRLENTQRCLDELDRIIGLAEGTLAQRESDPDWLKSSLFLSAGNLIKDMFQRHREQLKRSIEGSTEYHAHFRAKGIQPTAAANISEVAFMLWVWNEPQVTFSTRLYVLEASFRDFLSKVADWPISADLLLVAIPFVERRRRYPYGHNKCDNWISARQLETALKLKMKGLESGEKYYVLGWTDQEASVLQHLKDNRHRYQENP